MKIRIKNIQGYTIILQQGCNHSNTLIFKYFIGIKIIGINIKYLSIQIFFDD